MNADPASPSLPRPEVLLALLDGTVEASPLLREAAHLAAQSRGTWLAVHLDLARHSLYSRTQEAQLQKQLRLAEQLGAEVIQLEPGISASRQLLALARARQVTAIVLGHRGPSKWWQRLLGTLPDTLLDHAPELRVHLVPLVPERAPLRAWVPEYPGIAQMTSALLVVALATALDFVARPHVDLADLVMVYLLGITFVATRFGRMAALLTSLLCVAALDFCFIPPRFTFAVQDVRHLGTFGVMLGVGWIVANLAERIRAQARMALEREGHASALNRLGSVLAEGGSVEAIRDRVETYLRKELGMPVLVLLSNQHGLPGDADHARRLGPDEWAVAQWALQHAAPAGRGTAALPGARGLFLPMHGTEHPIGVLALFPEDRQAAVEPERQSLLTVLAAQISLALERSHLAEERTEARIHAEEEQLRNTLLSSVSHDLRTPLATITGATSNLLAPGPEADPGDQRMLLTTIHEEAGRLQRLVNNLLDLTKLESGQVKVHKEWVPLDEVVGSVLNRMEEQLAERRLELDLPEVWVPLDPVLFEQVLHNLLDNALKYSPAGSSLTLRAQQSEDHLLLLLSDQGPGIPQGEEERIFEKLYRGTWGPKTTGAGLGLAICRGIIQAHGGSIHACNAAAGGLEIRIALPIEGAPPELPPEGNL